MTPVSWEKPEQSAINIQLPIASRAWKLSYLFQKRKKKLKAENPINLFLMKNLNIFKFVKELSSSIYRTGLKIPRPRLKSETRSIQVWPAPLLPTVSGVCISLFPRFFLVRPLVRRVIDPAIRACSTDALSCGWSPRDTRRSTTDLTSPRISQHRSTQESIMSRFGINTHHGGCYVPCPDQPSAENHRYAARIFRYADLLIPFAARMNASIATRVVADCNIIQVFL